MAPSSGSGTEILLCKTFGIGETRVPQDYYFNKPRFDVSKGKRAALRVFQESVCFLGLLFQTQVQGGRLFCSTRVSGKTGTWKELEEKGRMWKGELGLDGQGGGRQEGQGQCLEQPRPDVGSGSLAPAQLPELGGLLKRRLD